MLVGIINRSTILFDEEICLIFIVNWFKYDLHLYYRIFNMFFRKGSYHNINSIIPNYITLCIELITGHLPETTVLLDL